jgi:hypothetical protein
MFARNSLQRHSRRKSARLRHARTQRKKARTRRGCAGHREKQDAGVAMSLKLQQRGKRYRAVGTIAGRFLRLSLGTANSSAASTIVGRVERAIAEGSASSLWLELKRALPPKTFGVLAKIVNFREETATKVWTWKELEGTFETEMRQRILLGKLAESTWERYQQTLRAFKGFVDECGVSELPAMTRPFIEKFKVWRLAKIQEKKFSRGDRGLALDVAILHCVFAVALECEMIVKNPVRLEGRPGDSAERGAQPFTGEQLTKLRQAANEGLLEYLLLRWTGLRGSDAVRLTWAEIDWEAREINRLTQKRKKRVVLPISQEPSWKVAKVWRKPIAQILHILPGQKAGFNESKRDSSGRACKPGSVNSSAVLVSCVLSMRV